jgi:hypothetical protein
LPICGARHRFLAVVAITTLGCEAGQREPTTLRPASAAASVAESFANQVTLVRAGQTSSIDVDVPPTAAEWESLAGLAGLRVFILRAGVATDAEATILAGLPALERLVLRDSPLSDEGFATLATITTLRDLNVPQSACTAAGIRALTALPSLERLRLGGPRLAGADVGRAVAGLPRLRSLHLIDIVIGDAGLDALGDLSGLRSLYLDGAGVSDGAWGRYFARRPDVHVHVDQAHHDRDPGRHEHP